jgi:hypothetical protein
MVAMQSNILESEIQTAARVARLIFDSGLARVARPDHIVSFASTCMSPHTPRQLCNSDPGDWALFLSGSRSL